MAFRDLFSKKKQAPAVAKRYYHAGSVDRLTASWSVEEVSIDDVINRNLKTLRARSREQYRNNDYASRFTSLLKANVIGPHGVVIQAVVENRAQFQSAGKYDHVANDAIEAAFRLWGRRGTCDLSGRLGWVEMQRLAIQTVGIDGECLVYMDSSADNAFGFGVRLIDPAALDSDLNVELAANRNRICFGIELDANDRPVRYYLKASRHSPGAQYLDNGRAYHIIPADYIIHLFLPEAVGQKRGLPMMAGALARMNMLSGYEDAAITAARVGAAKMGFFTSPDGESYTGTGDGPEGTTITDVQPGHFEQLPSGVDFTAFNPDYPHQQFGEFVKTCLRGISSGLNVSYHALSNDLEGVNYSSIRAGVLEDRETWKSLQNWFIEGFVQPIYERWVRTAVMRSAIKLPNGSTLRDSDIDRYLVASYQPRRWAWVDPQKDTTANVLAVQNALKSRSEIIREQGRDPEDVWRELADEQEQLKALGITSAEMSVSDAAALNNGAE